MKNINRFLLVAIAFVVTSCEINFLDEEMTTQLGGDQVYKKVSDYEMALIGVYDQLGTRSLPTLGNEITNYLSNYNAGVILLNELATDEMGAIAAGASKQLMLEELDKCRPTPQNGIIKSLYAGQYVLINRANDLIFHAEKTNLKSPVIDRCVGEAKFLRALTYYNLTSIFGGVVLTTLPGSERVGKVFPRSSTEAVYGQIFQDLKDAYDVLPVSFAAQKELGRATKIAAAALMARASLTAATMGKYAHISSEMALEDGINSYEWAKTRFTELITQAKTYAELVITEGYGGDKGILETMLYSDSFYPSENMPEIIFDVQFKDAMSQNEAGWVGQVFGPGSWNWVLPTGTAAGTYKPYGGTLAQNFPKDPTKATCDMRKYKTITNFQYKGDGTLWPPTAANKTYNLGKFAMERKPDYPKQQTPINYVVLRLAEMYLIIAEAEAELNNGPTDEAFKMVNHVRARAANATILPVITKSNMADPDVVKPIAGLTPTTDLDKFRMLLMQERMLEFLGESLRRVDLIRSGWIAEYLENTNIIDFDEVKYVYRRRQFEDYSIFYPIPSREITITNNVIKQNFGYGI
ncbi:MULTISPECIES: RagB/SusD family nutrient uptake outer membrane protein [Bacteroides]|uniref:RagB/SusD family nutrient uptake outer membrane protein n=1 Tax=Bacteroides TaxID=816 RepID=UPI000E7328E4|nr:RagB/SusD family nutrient uptake outer membrane protein [Bacteroides sp. AM16-13]RGD47895.1 RagB/SusD family nutrient uptake outer membrane protein [Bacteroides sp. AM16-13]